ncbi:MAG: oligopeptide/dipeptide ABC transporter ATP-binding protein [Bradyrhizobium sp. DFCI-1]|nr:MAG: oligopeptide/dipeptide ABC transporter ATP-binding protein [Bradyrhizobium sp. DFCI-1]
MTTGPLIEIEGLRVTFQGDDGRVTHAVDSVDLSVANGATLGLVGESGCGKSVTSLADEPTTALDVTLQAQILDLMRELKAASGAAIILITHDLGVVAEVCDEVAVMYAGEIVERAPVDELFANPQHPYTVGLLGSIPRLDRRTSHLATIEGMVPNMASPPAGCRFAARCPFVENACTSSPPPLAMLSATHASRCIRAPLERLVS